MNPVTRYHDQLQTSPFLFNGWDPLHQENTLTLALYRMRLLIVNNRHKKHGIRFVLLSALALLIAFPSTAHAYMDPGSGMLLWQLLSSFFIGMLFYLRSIIVFIKGRFKNKNEQ